MIITVGIGMVWRRESLFWGVGSQIIINNNNNMGVLKSEI